MPTRVMYNSNLLIPAPFVNISKNTIRDGAGGKIGVLFTFNIRGTLLAYKGSPSSTGTFHTTAGYPADENIAADSRLSAIERKQEAIRKLFSTDGLQLEFQSADGAPAIKCNPRITNIEFEEDVWYNITRYAIDCEADVVYGDGSVGLNEDNLTYFISDATENWSVETQQDDHQDASDPRTYIVTHTVTATGKSFYNSGGTLAQAAWQNARDYVHSKLGWDSSIVSQSILNVSTLGRYNHSKNIQYDEGAGSYSVVETWTMSADNYKEDFTVTATENASSGVTSVTIEGSIQGLETRTDNGVLTTSAYTNVNTAWASIGPQLHTRAQNYSTETLNAVALEASAGVNPVSGIITYSYQYDTRPTNYIPNSLFEQIVITDRWDVNVFAPITILGRTTGPLLQDIGTHRELIRELSIEVVMPSVGGTLATAFASKPSIIAVVNAANPSTYGVAATYVSDQNETWEPKTGRYTYNAQWTYENPGLIGTAGLRGNA